LDPVSGQDRKEFGKGIGGPGGNGRKKTLRRKRKGNDGLCAIKIAGRNSKV